MTQKEAIAEIERLLDCAKKLQGPQTFVEFRPVPALEMALAALRPVSREQVEKAEWIWSTGDVYICSSCGEKTHVDECMETPIYNFCPFCMSPMTDEAVEMVMERLEALHDTGD